MSAIIPNLALPEVFLGFVAPIGTDVNDSIFHFREKLKLFNYNVIEIKVTAIFNEMGKYLPPVEELVDSPQDERYTSHIKYGNQIRSFFEDDSSLASITIARLIDKRLKSESPNFQKTAYIINQLKRPEEIELFRSVYGRLFFQISVYSRRGARIDFLSRRIAESRNSAHAASYRGKAEEIISRDEHEAKEPHGQRVSKIFHDGDFIINTDSKKPSVKEQIYRFCDLIFGSNKISPTKIEYGMFTAKAAALRTLDLSRQVGAAIFSDGGEIISLGSNEVPKANGGTYWSDDEYDDREYLHKEDSNDRRKNELISDILTMIFDNQSDINTYKEKTENSQFMDALEYGRIVHAEMSAICDAARLGRALKSATLFSTTFPCHMCAKHIVAAGVSKVIFLEPYPKSLASDLHSDSIQIEDSDRGRYSDYPSVKFTHFYGVTPRRYREIFERNSRKNKKTGQFTDWKNGTPQPIMDIKIPLYPEFEAIIAEKFVKKYLDAISASQDIIAC